MKNYDFNNRDDVSSFVLENYSEVQSISERLNRDYLEQQMSNIIQRREFMKHITLLSGAILAFMPLIIEDVQSKPLFFISIGLHFMVIFVVLAIIKDIIDKDAIELGKDREEYNDFLGKDLNLHRNLLTTEDYSKESLKNYLEKRDALGKQFDNRIRKVKLDKKQKEGLWDFSLDLIIFFFTSALAFLLLAVVLPNICWQFILLILLGLFILSLFMPILKLMELISLPLSHIKNSIDKRIKNN